MLAIVHKPNYCETCCMSSCICLAMMGSGASGLALYWNCLVWVNTCAPFRATDREGRYAPDLDYTSSTVILHTAARKPSRPTGEVISVPFALFTGVRGR
jgi:hypothetical protein